jgi:hypothetical protein
MTQSKESPSQGYTNNSKPLPTSHIATNNLPLKNNHPTPPDLVTYYTIDVDLKATL